jgi:O-antigen ligase
MGDRAPGNERSAAMKVSDTGPIKIPLSDFERRMVIIIGFAVGFIVEVARIPGQAIEMPPRLESLTFNALVCLPFLAALVVFHRRQSPNDRLWLLAAAATISFTLSTVVGVVSAEVDDKLLTMVGSTVGMIIFLVAGRRMAESLIAVDILPLLRGLQVGWLVMVAYVQFAGLLAPQVLNENMQSMGFAEVRGINRNTVTLLAVMAMSASLTELSTRKRPSWLTMALGAATIGGVLYIVYRVPGKGAWVSCGLALLTYIALMIRSGRVGTVFASIGLVAAAAPFLYERGSKYMMYYLSVSSSEGFTGRTLLWQGAWEHIRERGAYFLGFGYESAYSVSQMFGVSHFHNEFVNAFFCGGVVGFSLLSVWILLYLYKATLGALRTVGEESARPIVFCCFFGAFIVSRLMSDVSITTFMEPMPMWLLTTAILGAATQTEMARRAAPGTSRWGALMAPPRGVQVARKA